MSTSVKTKKTLHYCVKNLRDILLTALVLGKDEIWNQWNAYYSTSREESATFTMNNGREMAEHKTERHNQLHDLANFALH